MKVKLLGLNTKAYVEKQVSICAAAGKLSRMPGTVFDAMTSMKEYNKALKFLSRVIEMGHTATIDHDYMVFALSGVSPIVEQTIIAERFCSFTIKSRREVDFSKPKFYTPVFHDIKNNVLSNNEEIQKKYQKHMRSLFKAYKKLVDNNIPKEDARFVLPYCYRSEIIMGLDGTSLVRMIKKLTKGEYSKITELKELGEMLYQVVKTRAPYISVLIDNEPDNSANQIATLLDGLIDYRNYQIVQEPNLLNYTENMDDILFENAISRIYGVSNNEAADIYHNQIIDNEDLKQELMKAIFADDEHEDLKQINMRFELSVPFAILTHYTRHRRLSLSIPAFCPNVDLTKYAIPPKIMESSFNLFYQDIYAKNHKIYEELKTLNIREEDLVYFTLSGNLVNVVINFDGESFRWICRLRECTKAQWCIRSAVGKMHAKINEVSKYYSQNLGPDCVTKKFCGEGKESCGRINQILKQMEKANEQK